MLRRSSPLLMSGVVLAVLSVALIGDAPGRSLPLASAPDRGRAAPRAPAAPRKRAAPRDRAVPRNLPGSRAHAADRRAGHGPAAALTKLLRRRALPDPELVLRLMDAEVSRAALALAYGDRHPRMRTLVARIAFLRRAVRSAPASGGGADAHPHAHAHARVARGLRRRVRRLRARLARLHRRYRARHPRYRRVKRRLTGYQGLLRLLTARHRSVGSGSSRRTAAGRARRNRRNRRNQRNRRNRWALVVQRAAARGRLRVYRARYGPQHPRIRTTRAILRRAKRRLQSLTLPPTGAACRALWSAYSRAIVRHRVRLAADRVRSADRAAHVAALDTLIAERAKLRAVSGCAR